MKSNWINNLILSLTSRTMAKSVKNTVFTKENVLPVIYLLLGSLVLIVLALVVFDISERTRAKHENRKPKTIYEIIGFSSKYDTEHVVVGMISNLIFGFIDNGGLFFGLDALDPFLPGGELIKAGLGNTFGDTLGAFLGTFIGGSVANFTQIDDTPLWANVIGVIIGCLLGVAVPALITGRGDRLVKKVKKTAAL